jgi:predicted ABC-class ATPase
MKDKKEFYGIMQRLDGKPYAEYGALVGECDFGRFIMRASTDKFDADAECYGFTIRVPQSVAAFPSDLFETPVRRTALEDMLARKFADKVTELGAGDSLGIAVSTSTILPRTTMFVTKEYVEARIAIALPYKILPFARGGESRSIDAAKAEWVFFEVLPEVISSSMVFCNVDPEEIEYVVALMEDATRIRQSLPASGLVSFVAEGSVVDGDPEGEPLLVDDSALVEMEVPNGDPIKGFGVPAGLTVIVGEDSADRAELIDAIAQGVYNHAAGDGREYVVTVSDAVQITAEEGRSVQRVDLSPFVVNGAERKECVMFTCENADAFSAQAASTIEALEAGARVLIFDEATSDVEFLGCDQRVATLFDSQKVPLVARVRQLVDELGLSIIVAGSSAVGQFLPIANTVFKIEDQTVSNITDQVAALGIPAYPEAEAMELGAILDRSRWVMPSSIDPSCMEEDVVVEADSKELLRFGRDMIDLSGVTQIADEFQAETIGHIMYYARLRYMDERTPLREVLDLIDRDLTNQGLGTLSHDVRGDFARPRRYEIAAALNRLRSFRVSHATQ